ncbi:hypothetical protein [Jatrophihabitans sp.]|uniref:hypothetical protein n=1 Tax=Jatrophihabitans sp. TaxID=1932789 RepID=UPI002D0BB845|nr:hypothetical protein [Jatrophihabitans sp.]
MGDATGEGSEGAVRRASIIEAVKTPLGFYALVVLVAEAILSVATAATDGIDRTILVIGMVAALIGLILLVAGISLWRPRALYGEAHTVVSVDIRRGDSRALVEPNTGDVPLKSLERPKVLVTLGCGPGDDLDAEIIEGVWPAALVTKLHSPTAAELTDTLLASRFDVLQLSSPVGRTGDITFPDRELSAAGLAELARQSNLSLIVLASCSSASMAAEIAGRTNMVAATETLSTRDWEGWSKIFYTLLASGLPMSQAYSVARSVIDAPVVMILHEDFTAAAKQV